MLFLPVLWLIPLAFPVFCLYLRLPELPFACISLPYFPLACISLSLTSVLLVSPSPSPICLYLPFSYSPFISILLIPPSTSPIYLYLRLSLHLSVPLYSLSSANSVKARSSYPLLHCTIPMCPSSTHTKGRCAPISLPATEGGTVINVVK